MPNDKIIIVEGQSLFDVATQILGRPEMAIQIMIDNGITDFSEILPSGRELALTSVSDQKVKYMQKQGIIVATKPTNPEGIDYWIIEDNFIVQ